MKNKRTLMKIGILILFGTVAYYFYQGVVADDGRVYRSKAALCEQFAQSYLKTIQKTDNITDYESEKWKMAIDIETDIYNLCLIDLKKEALMNYETSAIKKYQK